MAKNKISDYSSTANSNTDIASINIDENCAPSGINNAIRAVMGHLKDFQAGTNSDSFNGPTNGAHNGTVGATTPAAGTFTTLSATGNVTLGDAAADTVTVNGTTNFVAAPTVGGVGLGMGFKNRIINGLMTINQRGLTGPTSGYFVDRWQVGGVSATSLQTSVLPAGFTQAVSISRTVAGTAYIAQNIESKNVFDLNGQTVTVSFWAKNVSGVGSITVNLSYANASDNFSGVTSIQTVTASSSPSSSWTYYTASFTALPSSVANGLQLSINAVIAASGTLEVTGVQLEKGSTATSFDYRPYSTELALCQRYYYRFGGSSLFPWVAGYNVTNQYLTLNVLFPVQMRTAPSINTNGTFTTTNLTGQPTGSGSSTQGCAISGRVVSTGYAEFYSSGSTTYFDTAGAEL